MTSPVHTVADLIMTTQFYEYFYEQNQAIANGSAQGVQLNMNSLGVSSPSNVLGNTLEN